MTILVVGATGATGRLLVEELIKRGEEVRVIVRSPDNLPESIKDHKHLRVIHASLLDLSDSDMAHHVKGCDGVASCLGHNLTFKGIYGQPRKLVTDATRRLCDAVVTNNPDKPVRFVLMNTTGNRNGDLPEEISLKEKILMALIRFLLPPQRDNEMAAEYLRSTIGQNDKFIEWAAVRPDSLIDMANVSEYKVYPSPVRSAVFNAGQTSRINVGHFMAELLTDKGLWNKWKGQMPVIYNAEK